MQIHGLNKTTLLDYPEHVAATIFTGGCNFRCPFCHNKGLVISPETEPLIPEEEILQFLKKRQSILSGVCITGGEPTLNPDLKDFILKVKELGYSVKLDTNGYNPDTMIELIENKLIDYVAMDIKSSPNGYEKAAGIPGLLLDPINQSVKYLLSNNFPYEFRTTVVKELHTKEDFIEIGKWLSGCRAYFLQAYKDSDNVLCKGFTSYSKDELLSFTSILKPYITNVHIRGID